MPLDIFHFFVSGLKYSMYSVDPPNAIMTSFGILRFEGICAKDFNCFTNELLTGLFASIQTFRKSVASSEVMFRLRLLSNADMSSFEIVLAVSISTSLMFLATNFMI